MAYSLADSLYARTAHAMFVGSNSYQKNGRSIQHLYWGIEEMSSSSHVFFRRTFFDVGDLFDEKSNMSADGITSKR